MKKEISDMLICSSFIFTGPKERELPDFEETEEDPFPDEDERRDDEEVDENGIPYL